MSLPRLELTTRISDRLVELERKVKVRSRASLNDASQILETISRRFFNALFGWELVNLNLERNNFPAADLGDRIRRLAIQITNQESGEKISHTAAKAEEHKMGADFDRLIIFFLLTRKPPFPKKLVQPQGGPVIETWDIAELLEQLKELNDFDALARAAHVLDEELGKIREPDPEPRFDISRIGKYAPAELIGREAETKLLNDAWSKVVRVEKPRLHVIMFVALGGEGKTSLVAKWAAELAAQDWPGCDAVFAWSFYSQGTREQNAVSSDLFLAEALAFFGDDEDKKFASSPAGAYEKGTRLAKLIGQRRSLLLLDGLEPLQYAPPSPMPGELKDQGVAALLKGLAATSHGLCVVTTRYALPDLRAFLGKTVREEKLTRLSRAAGVKLLKAHGVTGSDRSNLPHTDGAGKRELLSEFERLVEDVDGHALTLHLMGSFLKRAFQGDIRRRDRVTFAKADPRTDNGHAFRAMAAYEKWMADGSEEARRELAILSLMGLFDRPATADCLHALLQAPAIAGLTGPLVGLPEEDWNGSLTALQDATLLTVNSQTVSLPNFAFPLPASLDAHPLLREYFAMRLRATAGSQAPTGHEIPEGSQAPTGRTIPAQGNALGSASKNANSPEGASHGADVSPLQGLGDSGAAIPGALPQAGLSRPVGARSSAAWREAHRRLYEHLCATTKEGDQPTLEDLQPLYQAVAHGCQAGLQREVFANVFYARITRGEGKYAVKKLGAFGSNLESTACFFETKWNRVSPAFTENDQAWLLNEAAFSLRALGRLTEAIEPMRAGMDARVKLGQFNQASISASNLSALELTLGDRTSALAEAEKSVTYGDRSGSPFHRFSSRSTEADALHQSGYLLNAEVRFCESEKMHAEFEPFLPLLYSRAGFRYCDLLLTEAERAAWQAILGRAELPLRPDIGTAQQRRSIGEVESCRAVYERAAQTLKWMQAYPGAGLLDIDLDQLTLGRAALYEFILGGRGSTRAPISSPAARDFRAGMEAGPPAARLVTSAATELVAAVSGLRRFGNMDDLPRGLLTRAWLRFLTGARTGPESAQSDLDEAWEIAARGPMPLFLADIHLYRARLFGRRGGVISDPSSVNSGEEYPWNTNPDGSPRCHQDDLAEARRLIVKHGYLRRLPEIEDAEQALGL